MDPDALPATDRDMLVPQHNPQVWSWADAAYANYWDKAAAVESRGVTMAAHAGDLVPGDRVSLGPLLGQLSQDELYTIDMDAARTTMAVVHEVLHRHFHDSGNSFTWISADQGQFTLGFNTPVGFLPGRTGRCSRCGAQLPDGPGNDGLCGDEDDGAR
ncbi:hypothetical protein [Myceligenerans halotolerans]